MYRERSYLCIDLKSFYASVECVERGLDPMTTDLVVADPDRSDKTICLAVSPSLRAKGVKNRCRLFEIPTGMTYLIAPPRMQTYIDYAANIYGIYLRYFSPDDIHVYSIDEVFIDLTRYLRSMGMTPKEIALFLMDCIRKEIGIRATTGIGTNLYLAKIALDITAKHAADFIGILDEDSYRIKLWDHRPLTDFWRVGPGTARRLECLGIHTMRQIAMADEDLLYKVFGIDAELLIDHAWGREPTTIADIHAYKPKSTCLTSGQVLMRDYHFEEGRLIVREMADQLCLDMVEQGVISHSFTLWVGYSNKLHSEPAKGSILLGRDTNADRLVIPALLGIYDRVVDKHKPIRRLNISCNDLHVDTGEYQMGLFDTSDRNELEKNRRIQKAMISVKKKFGKNAMFKGMDLEEAATTIERNGQIGGHKSGQ